MARCPDDGSPEPAGSKQDGGSDDLDSSFDPGFDLGLAVSVFAIGSDRMGLDSRIGLPLRSGIIPTLPSPTQH